MRERNEHLIDPGHEPWQLELSIQKEQPTFPLFSSFALSFVWNYAVWQKKNKMSTASKIFSKLNHITGVGNGGYLITKNPATPTAAFEIALIAVVENGGFWISSTAAIELFQKPAFRTAAIGFLSFRARFFSPHSPPPPLLLSFSSSPLCSGAPLVRLLSPVPSSSSPVVVPLCSGSTSFTGRFSKFRHFFSEYFPLAALLTNIHRYMQPIVDSFDIPMLELVWRFI